MPEGVAPLSGEDRNALLEQNVGLAGQALRVLAFAYKEQPADAPMTEEGLTFAALGAMSDPPRPEATHAIEAAHRAGIRVVMITGDNSLTAAAIGREVGLDGEGRPLRRRNSMGWTKRNSNGSSTKRASSRGRSRATRC